MTSFRVYSSNSAASHYDLVVLGSGPGGQRAAVQAAKLGKRVLVVEKDHLGGACLHLGTIPSKTLREAVLKSDSQMVDVMRTKKRVVDAEALVIAQQLDRNKIEFVQGFGKFEGPSTICVYSATSKFCVTAEKIVIAVGTHPHRPKHVPFDDRSIFDSDSILELQEKPRSMAVLGAGVIGVEYASIFAQMGVKVTLMDRRPDLLRSVDDEVSSAIRAYLASKGVKFRLGADIQSIELLPQQFGASVQAGGDFLLFDKVLYCMGRSGNVSNLGLEAAGIQATDRGLISVNEHYQTSMPHIYAVGDIIGSPALAASSSEQGRLAAAHAFGAEGGKFPEVFPYGIYTIPEISSVGQLESDLRAAGVPYIVGRALYKELARGKIIGDEHGFLKILVHQQTRKILGVHIFGSQATELVHIGQVAMSLGASIDFFVSHVFNYPTLAEGYKVAAYNAYNQLKQKKTQAA